MLFPLKKSDPECIEIDDLRVTQILTNLLSNAIKFTPENGKISIDVQYSKDSNISSATASVVADDTNEALEIRVTGVASKNIRWVAVVDISQVSWGTP